MVMDSLIRRSRGFAAGVAAGLVLATAEVIASAVTSRPPLEPLWMSASISLGPEVVATTHGGLVVAAGLATHLLVAAVYGAVYAFLVRGLEHSVTLGVRGRVTLGAVFGAAVWLLNIQTIARLAFPWFLGAMPLLHLALHAVAFGIPLGVFFDWNARHSSGAVPQRKTPRTAVRARTAHGS